MNSQNKSKQKLHFYALISFLIVVGITLISLPATFFDHGQSICISMLLFKVECFGCGMTRAIQHLIHFDFEGAYSYNKLAFIVFPMFFVLIIMKIRELYLKLNVQDKTI